MTRIGTVQHRLFHNRRFSISAHTFGTDNLAAIAETVLDPVIMLGTLWYVASTFDQGLNTDYVILSVMVFALSYPSRPRLELPAWGMARQIIFSWLLLFTLLLFFGWATGHLGDFGYGAIEWWFFLAPFALISAQMALRASMPFLLAVQGGKRRCIIVGMNDQGVSLARGLRDKRYPVQEVIGFVDDRDASRLPATNEFPLLATTSNLRDFVKSERIRIIYVSLPMAKQRRIVDLLESLRDTTASIYFVPDIFVTDLIQGHMSTVSGIPVVGVCESPLAGVDGPIKRLFDIVISSILILLLSPVLLAVAVGVKLSSPGPIVFKQRRYGLDGEEILVYKFRSMSVTEDGDKVYKQVTQNDARVTKFGALIRKTSLDELPQFFNVLNGGMSIVGPRPHAVAVNEQYRRQIPGYMVRHKVRPGITGWAQVNGFRGGDDLESMRARVQYDIEYLRNYSVLLDLRIIVKTALVVFRDASAY